MGKIIPALVLAVALATCGMAVFNKVSYREIQDCSTLGESKRIGAFVRELSTSQPSFSFQGETFTFREIWVEHRTLLTYPLVWFPVWKHQDGINLSMRLVKPPIPFRAFWVECDGLDYTYFDEGDGDRFTIGFDAVPGEPVELRLVDRNTKETFVTVSLKAK